MASSNGLFRLLSHTLILGIGRPDGAKERRLRRAVRVSNSVSVFRFACSRPTRSLVSVGLSAILLLAQVSPVLASTMVSDMSIEIEARAEGALSAISRDIESGLSGLRRFAPKKTAHAPLRPQDQNSLVTQLKLCPTQFTMYVGEDLVLTAIPVDGTGNPVNGVIPTYTTSNSGVATVSNLGTVTAIAVGQATITAFANTNAAIFSQITVAAGTRPILSDADWDAQHADDCGGLTTSESAPKYKSAATNPLQSPSESFSGTARTARLEGNRRREVTTADLRLTPAKSRTSGVIPASKYGKGTANGAGALFQAGMLGGTFGDASSSVVAATGPGNAIGSPPRSAQESTKGAAKQKNILGSSDFVFTAPVLSLPGRGVATNLALVYNSQVWSFDSNAGVMFFDLNKGWPAPGWSLGYGRLVPNYNNTQGTKQGIAYPGDFLLIQPDGTRVPIVGNPDGGGLTWISTDGSSIRLQIKNDTIMTRNVFYPDGTLVKFSLQDNNRYLPHLIETRNGDQISITYKLKQASPPSNPNCPSTPPPFLVRTAIDTIIDTNGRQIKCHYYGDTSDCLAPPADAVSHPANALASVTVTDQGGGSSLRTLVQLDYTRLTLNYNFEFSVDSSSPINGSQIWMVNSITYPQTGRGYLFNNNSSDQSQNYSGYGMVRRISVRQGMLGSATYGNEVAASQYNYPDPTAALPDVPQFTTRTESWTGTSASGSVTTTTGTYNYSLVKSADGTFETSTITAPPPDGTISTSITNTNSLDLINFGNVTSTSVTGGSNGGSSSATYTYTSTNEDPSAGGSSIRLASSALSIDGGPTSTTTYAYGNYGRLATVKEQGFSSSAQRITTYAYMGSPYTSNHLFRLPQTVTVTDNTTHTTISSVTYAYDESPLVPQSPVPPQHDSAFDTTMTIRGNITTTTITADFSTGHTIANTATYDIFGNLITETVSGSQQKSFAFSGTTQYSQPDSETDGSGPTLQTGFLYNPNTSEVTMVTAPNGNQTSYQYDSAWRVLQVTSPTGAISTTNFDKDGGGNDLLSYAVQSAYHEIDGTLKTITTHSYYDGVGRVTRSGSGAGASPASLDSVSMTYDSLGRLSTKSNPYSGSSTATTGGSPPLTGSTYDGLGRVIQVNLPGGGAIVTAFTANSNGNLIMVTDQVGRQRQTVSDGLGRVVKLFEQDPSSGSLTMETDYAYDMLDNLVALDQGGQQRTFVYDALSRLTKVTTPEAGAVNYSYNDFSLVATRQDARGVTTNYNYDGLKRLQTITYGALPAGVAATAGVTISYNPSGTGIGQLSSVTDAGGTENYTYDGFGRLSTKARKIDASSDTYTTGYQYNQADQLAIVTYPSGKQFRVDHDSRGRILGEDKLNSSGGVATSYVSALAYSPAQQVTSMTLGNNVVEGYSYDSSRLQLISQTDAKSGGSPIMNLTYNYTASTTGAFGVGTTAGNSGELVAVSPGSTIAGAARDETFTYDNVGRLLSASGWGAWQRSYTYDREGNRTAEGNTTSQGSQLQSIIIGTSTFTSAAFGTTSGPTNRISTVNGTSYQYDASGNLTSDGVHTYQYDAEGRLAVVDINTQNEADYSYDVNNWRVKKTTGNRAATTYYVWEAGRVIAEYGTAAPSNNGVRYYHPDQLSNRVITDTNAAVIGTEDTLPFGEDAGATSGAGLSDPYRFTDYNRDPESSTDYAVNRQYSSSTGRFMRPDPVVGTVLNPQTLNRYSYCASDPINKSDADGSYPRDQHEFITFVMAALLGVPGAGTIAQGAGDADNWFHATTGLGIPIPGLPFTVPPIGWAVNFPGHFGIPVGSLNGLNDSQAGHALHLVEDNSPDGPHQIVPGYSLWNRILNSFRHVWLNITGNSPDRAGKTGGWEAAWDLLARRAGLNPVPEFPLDLISHIVNTVNANNLTIVGVQVITAKGGQSLGDVNIAGATLVDSSTQNGITVNIYKQPDQPDFYSDPAVQAIERTFSYPGSSPVDEGYALYLYQIGQSGFGPGVTGWQDFNTWFEGLR